MNQLLDMSVTAVRQSFGQTVRQSDSQSANQSVGQSVGQSLCLSVCLSVCLTVSLSLGARITSLCLFVLFAFCLVYFTLSCFFS